MTGLLISYCSSKLEVRPYPDKGGFGLFAGRLIRTEDEMYCIPLEPSEPADYNNHSCNLNTRLSGQTALIALPDIALNEKVCYDYAMNDRSLYDELECACGASNCRRWISGNDWKKPELWDRYAGYCSPYLQRRIKGLQRGSDDAAFGVQAPADVFQSTTQVPLPRLHS
jgi:hypothetical protein